MSVPVPPPELAEYVGSRVGDPIALYLDVGAAVQRTIRELLDGQDLKGRRILDFGCGSGRVLRHFLDDADQAEFHGCDIHGPSIAWLQENLCPPLHAHHTGPEPPLPFPDDHFDVAWATSVFTHLGDSWARWLAELHRVLKPGGTAIFSILSEGFYAVMAGEAWDEDSTGMIVLGPGAPWDAGGPMVFLSRWWIEAHWGRAFEIERIDTERFAGVELEGGSQGVVVMRARPGRFTAETLEDPEPDEPRELAAAQHALAVAHRELIKLNEQHDAYAAAYQQEQERVAALTAERDQLARGRRLRLPRLRP